MGAYVCVQERISVFGTELLKSWLTQREYVEIPVQFLIPSRMHQYNCTREPIIYFCLRRLLLCTHFYLNSIFNSECNGGHLERAEQYHHAMNHTLTCKLSVYADKRKWACLSAHRATIINHETCQEHWLLLHGQQ